MIFKITKKSGINCKQMISNISRDAVRAATLALQGRRVAATEAEIADRVIVCSTCPAFDATMNRCKDCGCFLRFKQGLASSRCPRDLWAI